MRSSFLAVRFAGVLACSAVAVVATGCGPNLCEKSASAQKKFAGDCGADAPALLGAMCTANLAQCSAADQKILETTVACMDKLPACVSIAKDAWKLQRDGCLTGTDQLSRACLDAFFMGNPPGFDAGLPDAGAQAVNDGGNGLLLFAAANEDTVALAWEGRRTANVEKWLLVETDGVGENRQEQELTPGSSIHFTIPDAGMMSRRYFVAGLNANGDVLMGMPFSLNGSDAGSAMCMGPNDCAADKVCDLGQCKTQTCVSGGPNTCPVAYGCLAAGYCQRTGADGGIFMGGGGTRDAGSTPLPMISQEVGITPRPPMSPGSLAVGLVAGKRPDIAAFDTARVALALEQEGQLIAHPSSERGGDLGDERFTSFGLDTTGARVHLAWDFESNTLFACYVVGTGVRVQKSMDRGRTWGQTANTFLPPLTDDGGIGELYRDCDIAPWKNGGALMVTAEDEKLTLRELDAMLNVTQKGPAFTSIAPTDAGVGGIMAPSHPAIATHPGMGLVHVTFTGTRLLTGGIGDTEPYGVVRTGSSFGMPTKLTPVLGSAYPEDWTTVAIHPKTGQAVAAFTTILSVNAQQFSTVFVSLYSPVSSSWSTGSHLNVLVVDQNTTVLFPNKPAADTWFAYSPSFAPLGRDNLFALSFVAGKRDSNGIGDYRQYVVPFDLDRVPAITAGKGWFVPPVTKVSDVRVLDPRGSLGAPQPPVSALAGDSQISVFGVFVEGAGVAGDVEAPAQFFHWP